MEASTVQRPGAEGARSLVEGLDGPGIGKKSRQRPCWEGPAAGDPARNMTHSVGGGPAELVTGKRFGARGPAGPKPTTVGPSTPPRPRGEQPGAVAPTTRKSLRRASVRWVALGKPSERHLWAVAAGDLAVERYRIEVQPKGKRPVRADPGRFRGSSGKLRAAGSPLTAESDPPRGRGRVEIGRQRSLDEKPGNPKRAAMASGLSPCAERSHIQLGAGGAPAFPRQRPRQRRQPIRHRRHVPSSSGFAPTRRTVNPSRCAERERRSSLLTRSSRCGSSSAAVSAAASCKASAARRG